MKTIMVMFDSLNRHMLPGYGCEWTQLPNFRRLAERTVQFERSYVCSMPCMPARRDLHTGRPNFLHRSWGPLEPFDESVPQMLGETGVSSHLISDHYHYWEDGGATYHTRYDTWQFMRGQEGDLCIGDLNEPPILDNINGKSQRQDWVNRQYMQRVEDLPQTKTFAAGCEFIERNHAHDNWMLQIECFDPHEPFFSHRRFKDKFAEHYNSYDGPLFDWPGYQQVCETPEQVEHARYEYASLMSACDERLGDVLDMMDRHGMWDDTMFILWTDHGYLLGEHNAWAKNWMPLFEQVAHTPFYIWDPRCGKRGERRDALVQPAIDLGPTLLAAHGLEPTANMRGHDLTQTIADDAPVREAAIFGYHGNRVNVTDGRYVYMRGNHAAGAVVNNYTLMPTKMRGYERRDALRGATLAEPFSFTDGAPLLKYEMRQSTTHFDKDPHISSQFGDLLFDVENDPQQKNPLDDEQVERRMIDLMTGLMRDCEAPAEVFERLGIDA